jgi:hypothetical protein
MNSEFAQSRSFLSQTAVLRGGQAPRYWKRELFLQTARMARVPRSCAWIEELTQVHPLFLDQPLFGSCLEELTARDISQSEVATRQPSQLSRHFNHAQRVSKSTDSKPHSPAPERRTGTIANAVSEAPAISEASERHGQSAKVLQLPPRVETSVLWRFAGAAAEPSGDRLESATSAPVFPLSRPTATAPALKSSLPSRYWQDLVAHRAAKDLLCNWPPATRSVSSSASSMDNSSVSASPLLDDQWLVLLDGPMASEEILSRFAPGVEVSAERSVFGMKRSRHHAATDDKRVAARSEPLGHVRPVVRRAANHVGETQESVSSAHFDFDLQPEPETRLLIHEAGHSQSLSEQTGGPGLPAARGEEWPVVHGTNGSNMAPSALAASLPPLLPPVTAGAASLPLASALTRLGARRDETMAQGNDLNLLAAQMKRILDEEARRHGIDV